MMIRGFFANPTKGLRVDKGAQTVTLAWVLKKDKHLFLEEKGGVLGFIQRYVDQDLRDWLGANPVEVRYFDHDWALNDVALAECPAVEGSR